jgi:GH24 family phage-related lysozyme (muramidase)
MQYQTTLAGNWSAYKTLRYDLIAKFEKLELRPYNDGKNFVTIGIGFNLHDSKVRANVLAKMGYTNQTTLALLNNFLSSEQTGTAAQIASIGTRS